MLNRLPPDLYHVELVGFTSSTNGRSCVLHPSGCGIALVRSAPHRGIGMVLRLRLLSPSALAIHTIKDDGSDGCRVGFTKSLYAQRRGVALDGKLVRIIDVYHEHHDNVACRADHHRNMGFAHGEVLSEEEQNIFQDEVMRNIGEVNNLQM